MYLYMSLRMCVRPCAGVYGGVWGCFAVYGSVQGFTGVYGVYLLPLFSYNLPIALCLNSSSWIRLLLAVRFIPSLFCGKSKYWSQEVGTILKRFYWSRKKNGVNTFFRKWPEALLNEFKNLSSILSIKSILFVVDIRSYLSVNNESKEEHVFFGALEKPLFSTWNHLKNTPIWTPTPSRTPPGGSPPVWRPTPVKGRRPETGHLCSVWDPKETGQT